MYTRITQAGRDHLSASEHDRAKGATMTSMSMTQEEEFEALFVDPTRYSGNRRERAAFRRWAGEDRFDEWYRRGHALATDKRAARQDWNPRTLDPVQSFEADWYSEGPQAYVDWLNNERRQDVLMEAIQTARKAGYQEGFEAGRLAERNGEQT